MLLTVLTAVLFINSVWGAGPPWRDEVNSIQMARMPWPELWSKLSADSSPLGHYVVLKAWLPLFGPEEDVFAIRTLGCLIGLLCMGAYWWAARQMGAVAPALFFALLFLNPQLVRSIGTVRPYGFSVLMLLLVTGLFWRHLQRPTRSLLWLSILATLLACHFHYLNILYVVSILACCWLLSGFKPELRPGCRGVTLATAIGAISMLPYAPAVAAASPWANLVMVFELPAQVTMMARALTAGGYPILGCAALAILFTTISLVRARPFPLGAAFAFLIGTAPLVLFLVYSVATHNAITPWYITPPLALTCLGWDAALAVVLSQTGRGGTVEEASSAGRPPAWGLALKTLLLAAGAGSMVGPALAEIPSRQTNVDLLALGLKQNASRGDYIVIVPWYFGVSFNYYYRGETPWETLPPLPDHVMHRYDLVARGLAEGGGSTGAEPVLQQVRKTLRSGGTVWVLGGLKRLDLGGRPEDWKISAAASPRERYRSANTIWAPQLVATFEQEGARVEQINATTNYLINSFEEPSLYRVTAR